MKNLFKFIAVLLFCGVSANVNADSFKKNNITYTTYNDSTAYVSACSATGKVIFPSTVTYKDKTYKVTAISKSACRNNKKITSVVISEGIKFVGAGAFSGCTALSSASLPEGLKSVGAGAFSGCTALSSVNLPEGLDSINSVTFEECYALPSITIPSSVTYIGGDAFENCYNLASVTFAEPHGNLKKIIMGAFSHCSFTEIEIPEGVTDLGIGAFSDCTNLTTITFPSTLTSDLIGTFMGCNSIKSIYCYMNRPSVIVEDAFSDKVYTNATLYVPEGREPVYAAMAYWYKFKNIKEFDTTGIENAEADDKTATEVERYSLNGTKLMSPQSGVNIIKMSNGAIKKVIVK